MSETVHTEKPTLPPIQFLLQNDVLGKQGVQSCDDAVQPLFPPAGKPVAPMHHGHRSTHSASSLPSDLQSLSLYPTPPKPNAPLAPVAVNTRPQPIDPEYSQPNLQLASNDNLGMQPNRPSWMGNASGIVLPQPHSLTVTPAPSAFTPHHAQHHFRRPPGATHGRSVSECTLPPPPLMGGLFPTHSPGLLSTGHGPHRQHSHHRRTVSANTVDHMILPSISASSSSSSTSSHPQRVRAQSDSPPGQALNSPPLEPQSDAKEEGPVQPQRDGSGRYPCPYCNKAFSRPSSLVIHTYSHTGEKPFVCTEEGCGRRFNVQSNMRRHLRVHRSSRSSLKAT